MENPQIRVLAVGGDRTMLVSLARLFRKSSASFAACSDINRINEAVTQLMPQAIVFFANPAPTESAHALESISMDQRWAQLPLIFVGEPPEKVQAKLALQIPEPFDINELMVRIFQLAQNQNKTMQSPPPLPSRRSDTGNKIPYISTRILLVDDDPTLVRLFSTTLRKSTYEVMEASNGEEGLAQVLAHRPDLVIADLNMPRLDGWGLLRAMRADHRVAEIPVMCLSCHDDYRENLKALSAGAQDYLAKGGKLETLVARLHNLLAPRETFFKSLYDLKSANAKIEELGVQWALLRLSLAKTSGMLTLLDHFWKIELGFVQGNIVFGRAMIGNNLVNGKDVLSPLVALRAGELIFDYNKSPPSSEENWSLFELMEKAALKNNEIEALALDKLMVGAKSVEVDEKLYRLYEEWGPPQSREIAALIRGGLVPKQIFERSERSPLEIEETLRDLMRRRVLRLT